MALQGSIDTFALDDVLRLVAGTGKTGRLTLVGSRGRGELLVLDGRLLDGSVSTDERVGDLHELVFELLRFGDGEFQFETEVVEGVDGVQAAEVDEVLNGAAELLAEWREIERVVPSGRVLVQLRADGPGTTVQVEPSEWRVIAAIGSGVIMDDLAAQLETSHLSLGRLLCSLVEAQLVTVSEAGARELAPEPEATEPVEVAPVEAAVEVEEAAPEATAPEAAAPGYAPYAADSWSDAEPVNGNGSGNGAGFGPADADLLFESVHQFDGSDAVEPAEVPVDDAPVVDAAEFARRLAELPPRAAKAVAAAARATTAEEREAALAELDGTGEEVDHEVLLQLLGPVEG